MKNSIEDFEISEWRTRMRFMADLVFATAMTIMILNLDIPGIEHISSTKALTTFMLKQLSGMGAFFIAFVTVAVYWMKHLEHYGVTLKVDQSYMWFQLLFLAFIMLIPFWSTYVGEAPDNVAIKVFLSLNMVFIGLFSYLSMNYAANPKHRLISADITEEDIKEAKKQILAEPAIAILAGGLAFVNPVYWDVSFILIPVVFIARKKLIKTNYFNFSSRKK